MFEARQGKEIVVKTKNDIGVLLGLSRVVAEKGVGILAVNGVICGEDCVIRLVTDDNLRAVEVLRDKGYAPREEGVVLMELPHKPGMLKRVTEVLSGESIDVHHLYATALERHEKTLVVFHTSNDEHALPRLNRMKLA